MHITYRHHSLADADRTLNLLLEVIVEGTWDWNRSTGQVDRSPGWYRMLGYAVGILRKDVFTWENLIHPDDYPRAMQVFEAYITGQSDHYEVEYRCRKHDGSYLWIRDRGLAVERDTRGHVLRMIGAHQDIDQLKRRAEELQEKNALLQLQDQDPALLAKTLIDRLEADKRALQAQLEEQAYRSSTDPLTGIANRKQFEDSLFREVARSRRYGHPLCLAILDIDHFKRVNDRYGHDTGDEVLKRLSRCVSEHIRTIDLLARWGGEEFTIIFPDSDLRASTRACEKIRALISCAPMPEDLELSCSFGVAEYHVRDDVQSLFQRADRCLYQAKRAGRNRVRSEEDSTDAAPA